MAETSESPKRVKAGEKVGPGKYICIDCGREIHIDEVDKEGSARISDAPATGGNVASFPFTGIPGGQKGGEE